MRLQCLFVYSRQTLMFSANPLSLLFLLLTFGLGVTHCYAQTESSKKPATQRQIKAIAANAFSDVHDGWSSDEVILQEELNEAFISKCRKIAAEDQLTGISEGDLNWALMNLRKAGKLKSKTTKRKKADTASVRHVAEIVTRSIIDKHQCSIDRLMCRIELRSEFDESAQKFDDSIDLYAVRKAAFQLRKARRLKPELIGRIADWGRKVETHKIAKVLKDPTVLAERPGIYIFRDATGYLYIGQTDNLRERLQEHLDESHNVSLAGYLKKESQDSITIEVHSFDPDSKASEVRVRRAYESELIASRKPRFNLQP